MKHFEAIDVDFDQELLFHDLMETDVLNKSHLATVIYNNGRSKYDQDGFFDDRNDVTHYDENGNKVEGKYNTFVTYNFTHIPGITETEDKSFIDTPEGRKPIWHVYDTPWQWKEDVPSSLKEAVSKLNLSYISCVRLVAQVPPSKGIVHVDADYKDNVRYYKKGGVSITFNVKDGGGHLEFRTPQGLETLDESKHKCWHFNDALPHCTTEVTSPRLQIRIFGRK